MQHLPPALVPLASYAQFLLWKAVPRDGKITKLPINPHTFALYDKGSNWQSDASSMTDAQTAINHAELAGPEYGVGFLFTERDPFYFVDLDGCLGADGVTWSPVAVDIMSRLNGAAVEVSQSGTGLHIFGTGAVPEHGCRNAAHGLEFYTEGRFVALTGNNTMGSAALDTSSAMPSLVSTYFPATSGSAKGQDWTTEPVPQYSGAHWTDTQLIEKALSATTGAAAAFGAKASFSDLWTNNEDVFADAYPDQTGRNAFDASAVDAALAQHLAFWTGNNCERILELAQQSGLVREKWDREDYLERTILKAVSMQTTVYSIPEADNSIAEANGACRLKGVSESQIRLAEGVRATKLATVQNDPELMAKLCQIPKAKMWLDNQDCDASQIAAKLSTIEHASNVMGFESDEPQVVFGYQLLGADGQIEHFRGCTYIQDIHRVFTPSGAMLRMDQFNATYGGYSFQIEDNGDNKSTNKAWEAFTESRLVRYRKAEGVAFRPDMTPGVIFKEENRAMINTYIPIETARTKGDPTPFINHLNKLLPDPGDAAILLSYMAACVQYKGVKFQWCPLIQGAEGNGKTLFTRCLAAAIGNRYTHLPPAQEIAEKFNEWLFNKLFIGVEDIFIPDSKREVIEVLKPMITNSSLAMRAMQQSQIMGDNRANFILNSNHRDGVRKTENDRRFCMFYTAQQSAADIVRDGMDGSYFPELYNWLNSGGYAIVTDFLTDFDIPEALNPAGACNRAPNTTSTQAAINESMGVVEQSIEEAAQEGRTGFAGGWISSVHLDLLLKDIRRTVPPMRRRELLQSLGYDWHPALTNGRANNPIALDLGKKSILFIKAGSVALNLTRGADVAKAYLDAQAAALDTTGKAAEVFNINS